MISEREGYVSLTEAAKLLKTDTASLIGAALNGDLKLYWPLNQVIEAELVYWEPAGDDGSPSTRMMMSREFREFSFVPLTQTALSQIINNGSADVSSDPLSLPDADGYWWQAAHDSRFKLPAALEQSSIFVKRSDCEVSAPAQEISTRSKNTLLVIIAAVLKAHKVDYADRGTAKYLETLTQQLGAFVSEDTIKKYLDEIRNALKSRKK